MDPVGHDNMPFQAWKGSCLLYTSAPYPGTNRPIWRVMENVLTPTDVMPPNAPFLTDAGLHTLLDWIDAGAPPAAGDGGCE